MPARAHTVLLLRHGEETDHEDDPSLSAEGWCRAWALVGWLQTRRGLPAPSRLFAAADDDDSCRPRATLEHLASVLALDLDTRFGDGKVKPAARAMRDAAHPGAVTVACWRHERLPLARALGAPAKALPREWPDGQYGWFVRIDYDATGAVIASRCGSQRLMRADKRRAGQSQRP